MGLRAVPEGTGAEALYLHLAARKPPREQFASSDERRSYFIWQLQRGIVAAGAPASPPARCTPAAAGSRRSTCASAPRCRRAKRARRPQQYERITATFPVTQTTTENLRVTVVEFRRIAERSASPERRVRARLAGAGAVPADGDRRDQLERASRRAARRQTRRAAAGGDGKPAAQSDATLQFSRSRAASTRRSATTTAASPRRCSASPTRWRAAATSCERTQLPFDITSEGTLTGDIGAAESSEAPRFTIALARRLP